MAITLTVQGDVQKITRHLSETERRIIPSVSVQALNEVARTARTEGIKEAAQKLRLTATIIRRRFDLGGNAKGDRIEFLRASSGRPSALLRVYHRGIPVGQVAGAQVMRKGGGVKAMGKRFYQGAFKAKGLVFKRKGPGRLPLMVPKISVRKTLEESFGKRMVGVEGQRRFRQVFAARLDRRLQAIRT